MDIVFAASECVPYAKTGGLADVVGALPREIVKLGHRVTVYIPLYPQVERRLGEKRPLLRSITIPFAGYNRFAAIVDGGQSDGVQFYFVDCPELFARESLYATPAGDYPDNWERFALLSRAVLEAAKTLGVPQVFHVHDWQTAMLPVYLRTVYDTDPLLRPCGCMLTIHNAGYQGWFPPVTTERLLLPWEVFTMDRLEQYDSFNYLKGGIVYADLLTTVSRRYAEEIQTPEFGGGLEGVLRRRAADLHGILNGVDYGQWNPETDRTLDAHYSADALEGKAECRRDLLHAFAMSHVGAGTPVLGIVSRFATQKGFDLLEEIADDLADRDVVLIALGTGEPYYENFFRALAAKYPQKVAVRVQYDEALAHKVEAGSDLFLMPSRYEPGGLNQLYSLRYGTVPVVRATGGLDDTIEEWNPVTRAGNGFKFYGYRPSDFLAAIDRALAIFAFPGEWRQIMRNGMQQDFGWSRSAQEYARLYEEVARRRG